MLAEVVTEGEVTKQLPGVLGTHIQVVGPQMGLIKMAEGLPPGDAQASLVEIADGLQPGDDGGKGGDVGDDRVNADDGLCGKTGHRGASHMLNGNSQTAGSRLKFLSDGFKIGLPVGVIGQYDDIFCRHIRNRPFQCGRQGSNMPESSDGPRLSGI